jgi:hypothetical protein
MTVRNTATARRSARALAAPMTFLMAAVPGALLGFGLAHAETVVIDDQVTVRASDLPRPAPGMSMKTVEERFGAPSERHQAVGTPPITRWDYPAFAVYFEKDRVIHAVVIPAP